MFKLHTSTEPAVVPSQTLGEIGDSSGERCDGSVVLARFFESCLSVNDSENCMAQTLSLIMTLSKLEELGERGISIIKGLSK